MLIGLALLGGSCFASADYDSTTTAYDDAPLITNYSYDSVGYGSGSDSHTESGFATTTMYDDGTGALPSMGAVDIVTHYTYDTNLDGMDWSGTGQMTTRVTYDYDDALTHTTTYSLEVLDMSGSGDWNGHVTRYEYDSQANAPITTETVSPDGPGNFHIHSFFDVFTEISLDNGATWLAPTTGGVNNNGERRFVPSATPEPVTIGLGVAGLFGAVRRKLRRAR